MSKFMDQHIIHALLEAREAYPDRVAINCDNMEYTYRALAETVARYSHFMTENGVSAGDVIGIPLTNSVGSVALLLAVSAIGASITPINPTQPINAVKNIFESVGVKHIFGRARFISECAEGGITVSGISVSTDKALEGALLLSDSESCDAQMPNVDAISLDAPIILTTTSGSTGTPKPINLTLKALYRRGLAFRDTYGVLDGENVMASTPLFHTLAIQLTFMSILAKASFYLLPRYTPAIWLDAIEKYHIHMTVAVSVQLASVLDYMKQKGIETIEGIRCIVSSSALLDAEVRSELIRRLSCEFHENYGTSETSTVSSINYKIVTNKQKSVGSPFGGAELRILRADGSVADANEIGEITAKTPLFFGGYYQRPELTEEAFADGFFKTGDLGYLDEDGFLYYSGRKKEMISSGAINVFPSDIEQVVNTLPGVAECAAFAYSDERLGEVVALVAVPNGECELKKRAIRSHCLKNLADYQQPHHYFVSAEPLPRNAMGKLMRMQINEYIERSAQVME